MQVQVLSRAPISPKDLLKKLIIMIVHFNMKPYSGFGIFWMLWEFSAFFYVVAAGEAFGVFF